MIEINLKFIDFVYINKMYYADRFWPLLKIFKVYDMDNTGTYPLELLSSFNSSVKTNYSHVLSQLYILNIQINIQAKEWKSGKDIAKPLDVGD